MANRVTTWSAGDTLTAADLNGEFDNIYTGTVDRTAGRWGTNDDIPATFGSSQDVSITWNTTQTNDSLVIGVGGSNTILICEEADKGDDFALSTRTEPTLTVAAADKAGTIEISGDKAEFVNTAIAHGMTSILQTGAGGAVRVGGTAGGLVFEGLSSTSNYGTWIRAGVTTDDTVKTTSADAPVRISGHLKSGTALGAMGADANVCVVRANNATRFIFDNEGSFHADVESTTFDDYDDIALIRDMEAEMIRDRDPVKASLIEAAKYNKGLFEELNLVHFDPNLPSHAMINLTRLQMLTFGAIRQMAARIEELEARS